MSLPTIQVENLSKKFIINHEAPERYLSLRDVIAKKARWLTSREGKKSASSNEDFYALNDVSFEVQTGDRLGIIGRNGAGKSTLLKILSRITEPSRGRITIRGRVASLLEVGTGFHPELTGRENIFLNGAILGMSRSEIRRKFDEIVDFAEIEKFLDTPVKRYSSGMYVRLAFAVAAHLEPEILVVDEVLAVGDSQFQKKCLGKMEDVSKNEGRTVLFVSHNMEAIETLTQNCIYLKSGKVSYIGETKKVVSNYLHDFESRQDLRLYSNRAGNGKARVVKAEVVENNTQIHSVKQGKHFKVVVGIESYEKVPLDISFVLENFREQSLFCSQYSDENERLVTEGYFEVSLDITVPYIRSGDYLFSMAVFRPDKSEFYDVVLHFPLIKIEGMDDDMKFPMDDRWGDLFFPLKWIIN